MDLETLTEGLAPRESLMAWARVLKAQGDEFASLCIAVVACEPDVSSIARGRLEAWVVDHGLERQQATKSVAAARDALSKARLSIKREDIVALRLMTEASLLLLTIAEVTWSVIERMYVCERGEDLDRVEEHLRKVLDETEDAFESFLTTTGVRHALPQWISQCPEIEQLTHLASEGQGPLTLAQYWVQPKEWAALTEDARN